MPSGSRGFFASLFGGWRRRPPPLFPPRAQVPADEPRPALPPAPAPGIVLDPPRAERPTLVLPPGVPPPAPPPAPVPFVFAPKALPPPPPPVAARPALAPPGAPVPARPAALVSAVDLPLVPQAAAPPDIAGQSRAG